MKWLKCFTSKLLIAGYGRHDTEEPGGCIEWGHWMWQNYTGKGFLSDRLSLNLLYKFFGGGVFHAKNAFQKVNGYKILLLFMVSVLNEYSLCFALQECSAFLLTVLNACTINSAVSLFFRNTVFNSVSRSLQSHILWLSYQFGTAG